MKEERTSVIAYVTSAIAVGILSSFIDATLAMVISISVLVGLTYVMKGILKKEVRWFLGANGMISYIFVWIITWTIALGF